MCECVTCPKLYNDVKFYYLYTLKWPNTKNICHLYIEIYFELQLYMSIMIFFVNLRFLEVE